MKRDELVSEEALERRYILEVRANSLGVIEDKQVMAMIEEIRWLRGQLTSCLKMVQ